MEWNCTEILKRFCQLIPDLFKGKTRNSLGKVAKIELINFGEFSPKGGGVPPIRENNFFFHTKGKNKSKNVQNTLKHVIK